MKTHIKVAFVVTAVLTFSGCVVAPGSGASPEDARARFTGILDSTQDALGGSWQNQDDPTPRNCTVPLWVDGVRFPGLRLGNAPESPNAALRAVDEHWSDLGVSSERTTLGNVTELRGTNPSGDLFIFRVNEEAMTLQGESECRPEG